MSFLRGLAALAAAGFCVQGHGALLTDFAGSCAIYQQCTSLGADFDIDGNINGADMLIWQRGVGLTGQLNKSFGDADGNGVVAFPDLNLWSSQFGAVGGVASSACFKLYFDPVGISEGQVTAVVDVPDAPGLLRLDPLSENAIISLDPRYRVRVLETRFSTPPGRQRFESTISFSAVNPLDLPQGPVTIFGYQVQDRLPAQGLAGVQVGFEFQPGNFITLFDSDNGVSTTLGDAQLQDVPLVLASPLLQPGDPVRAIDIDPPVSNSNYPPGSEPFRAVDGNPNTKYANTGRRNTGFIAATNLDGTPTARSMILTTANNAPEGDPTSYALFGTNDLVLSGDNSDGQGGENWSFIAGGALSLPLERNTAGQIVSFDNSTSYTSYRLVFPEIRNFRATGAMQIGGAQLFITPDALPQFEIDLRSGNTVRAIQLPTPQADSPLLQGPATILDRNPQTKYSNFGKENSGFIVTPSVGPTRVTSFEITTANDNPSGDPASWMLYGTNAPILSADFSQGNLENWTLIDSGALSLPNARLTVGEPIRVDSSAPFLSYRMVFPTLKATTSTSSVQFAEIQLFGVPMGPPALPVPEPGAIALAAGGAGLASLARTRRRGRSG